MAFRLSNTLLGALNLVTLLLSVPIFGGGIWLRTRGDGTECDRSLSTPIIALGAVLAAVSLAGLAGACCRVTWLIWAYLAATLALIVALLCFTAFAFAVTSRGDYSTWLQRRVGSAGNWARIRACLAAADPCGGLRRAGNPTSWAQLAGAGLSPVQSGCCKPPTSCNFTYAGDGTRWTKTASVGPADPDCDAWSDDAAELCYGCQACKAGVVDTLKRDWKRVAVINAVFLAFIVVVYSVGCCAFRNSRRDNAYRGGGWKQGGYA